MPLIRNSSSEHTGKKSVKQIYSGYRIRLQANQLGIPAIPTTIKGACGDIVHSLRDGPVNFALDELNRLLNNSSVSNAPGSVIIALASIASESTTDPGTWLLGANASIPVGAFLIIESGITFVIPSGITLTVDGTLQVAVGGSITVLGDIINNNNTIQVEAFATFVIDGGRITNNGTFTNSGRLDIINEGDMGVNLGSLLQNNGEIYIANQISAIRLSQDATIQNTGTIGISDSASIQISTGSTFQNNGPINLYGTATMELDANITFINTSLIQTTNNNNITGSTNITNQGGSVVTNATIESPPACGALAITSPLTENKSIELCQTFTIAQGATFTIPLNLTLTNRGIITVNGSLVVNGTLINEAYINLNKSASICNLDSSGNFINSGTCVNKGSIYVINDGSISNTGNINNTAGYIYRGAGGNCGTGIISGTIQGRQPQVGCPPGTPLGIDSPTILFANTTYNKTTTALSIAWNAVSGATGYKVFFTYRDKLLKTGQFEYVSTGNSIIYTSSLITNTTYNVNLDAIFDSVETTGYNIFVVSYINEVRQDLPKMSIRLLIPSDEILLLSTRESNISFIDLNNQSTVTFYDRYDGLTKTQNILMDAPVTIDSKSMVISLPN